jgi:hypothetical protein
MAGNPLLSQGTLNRIRASVVVPGNSSLNVTAPFLHKEGISLALEGESTTYIPTMTGMTTSPEPYMSATVSISLLKTQSLAGIYKAQMENLSTIGDITVYPDVSTGLPTYTIVNCAIESVREMKFNGEDAAWVVMIKGYYVTNNALFNL